MKKPYLLVRGIVILLIFFMSACGSTPAPATSISLPTDLLVQKHESSTPRITATSLAATQTNILKNTPTQRLVNFTPTLPKPLTTPESSQPAPFKLCTPLVGHDLNDLIEIISNPYDPPPVGKETGHHGIDFAYYRRGDRISILGVPIQSVMDGKVAGIAMNRPPYGYMVIIETPVSDLPLDIISVYGIQADESLYVLYAHMDKVPLVSLDESVHCGTGLGEVGNTPEGWSSNPHLHLETRIGKQGGLFPSIAFYTTSATIEEMDLYRLWRTSGEFRLVDPMIMLEYGLRNPQIESE